jgi:hypothetical protein
MHSRPASAGPRLLLALTSVVTLLAGACGTGTATPSPSPSSAATLLPILITSPLVVGENRVLFSYVDPQNQPAAAPDREATVAFIPEGAAAPAATATGEFAWGIEDVAGIYVTHASLPAAGKYTARFTTTGADGTTETADMSIDVLADDPGIGVGDPAPPSDSKTLADVGGDVTKISTDEAPVERFYETSIQDAVAAKEPFVVVFATPAFCQTQQCGPTLERVKAVTAEYPELTVINVEPYELEEIDGRLQPVLTNDQLTPVQAVADWDLRSEPWVFVVDRAGVVQSSLGLIFLDSELTEAIDGVLAGA